MKMIGLVVLVLGALVSFGAAPVVSRLKKREATEKEILNTKLSGLLVAAIGLVFVLIG